MGEGENGVSDESGMNKFKKIKKEVGDRHVKQVSEAGRTNKKLPGFCIITSPDIGSENLAAISFVYKGYLYSRFLETGELIQIHEGRAAELYESLCEQRREATGENP